VKEVLCSFIPFLESKIARQEERGSSHWRRQRTSASVFRYYLLYAPLGQPTGYVANSLWRCLVEVALPSHRAQILVTELSRYYTITMVYVTIAMVYVANGNDANIVNEDGCARCLQLEQAQMHCDLRQTMQDCDDSSVSGVLQDEATYISAQGRASGKATWRSAHEAHHVETAITIRNRKYHNAIQGQIYSLESPRRVTG